jgi:hypothetical protein
MLVQIQYSDMARKNGSPGVELLFVIRIDHHNFPDGVDLPDREQERTFRV